MQQPTRVYLDNAATTPLDPAVRAAMEPYWHEVYGNASSPYAVSRSARMAIDRARASVAALVGSQADEIVFTSGGTESDAWALLGVALRSLKEAPGRPVGQVIVSAIEHPSVLETAETLRELGFRTDLARANGQGVVEPDEVARLLQPDTLLVSVMAVNNEVGTVQPLREIGDLVKEHSNALLHTDAVQAAGKIDLNVDSARADLMSLSAHKFYGPKGAGALYVRRGTRLHPLLRGGAQERGRRAGTENVAAIVGMGAAAELARAGRERNAENLTRLQERLENGLRTLPGVAINGGDAPRAPHISNACVAGTRAESLALALDMEGFAVGTGSACASGALEPSHVLIAMGRTPGEARTALRFSLGTQTSEEDVDSLLRSLHLLVGRTRG